MSLTPLLHALGTPSLGGIDGRIAAPLMTGLLRDRPLSVKELADGAQLSLAETSHRLAAMPETEYDDAGNINGYVLSRLETPHRFRVCDTQLFTWCPFDAVIVPRLIGRTAHIEGLCGATNERVSFISAPEGTYCSSHPDLTISLPHPSDLTHLRSAFCGKVRFFISPDAAESWLGPRHECHTLRLAEAYTAAMALVHEYIVPRQAADELPFEPCGMTPEVA